MKKNLIFTTVTVEVELVDKVTKILEEAGWIYTGSHQPYKINGILKQVIHFQTEYSADFKFTKTSK